MVYSALGMALVVCVHRSAVKAPLHDVTQHRGARLAEVSGEVIDLLPRFRVEPRIHAHAGVRAIDLTVRWCMDRHPCRSHP